MTRPIAALDVPAAWYETVFDLLACAHPEACNCPEETR